VAAKRDEGGGGRLLPWAIFVSLLGTAGALTVFGVQWFRTRELGRPGPIPRPAWLSRRARTAP
jgi:hypothetical protein